MWSIHQRKNSLISSISPNDYVINLQSTHPLITPDYGAMVPRTAVDFFPCCGAIAFFSLLSIKRAASERLEIMQSFTNKADELYLEAENVRLPDYIPPFTSCYETLFQQEELIERARTMEDLARQIRQQFQAIADSGFPVPTSTLLRKAVVSVRNCNCNFFFFVIVITFYSPSCLGQETAKGPFGLRVKLPPAHLSITHDGGFTLSL